MIFKASGMNKGLTLEKRHLGIPTSGITQLLDWEVESKKEKTRKRGTWVALLVEH